MSSSSSSLVNLVPQLNGENYPFWAKQMRAYLMSQGKWSVIAKQIGFKDISTFTTTQTSIVPATTAGGTPTTATTSVDLLILNKDDPSLRLSEEYVEHLKSDDAWTEKDSEVQGILLLRCIPAISDKISTEDCAYDMWAQLLYQTASPAPPASTTCSSSS